MSIRQNGNPVNVFSDVSKEIRSVMLQGPPGGPQSEGMAHGDMTPQSPPRFWEAGMGLDDSLLRLNRHDPLIMEKNLALLTIIFTFSIK